MAKNKTRKNSKKKQKENEILLYVYALFMITLSLIGGLQIGFVGQLLTGCVKYIFGNLYGIVYGVAILYAVLLMLKRSFQEIPLNYTVALGVLLTAWLLAASVPDDNTQKGMAVLSTFVDNSAMIFSGELASGGGLIGAMLVSVSSFLFDYTGTWIIITALLLLGLILLASGAFMEWMSSTKEKIKEPLASVKSQNKERRTQRKAAKQEARNAKMADIRADEPLNEEPQDQSILAKMSLEERVKKGQVSFLEADEDHEEPQGEAALEILSEETEMEAPVSASSNHEVDENQRIINETIGKQDTFVSQFVEDYTNYRLPRLNLLKDSGKKGKSINNINAANDCGRRLIEILDQFGVKATLVATHIGPAVTKFEVKPDLGVRVNKISNLQYDIKMALAAKDIRIEAPIPGKSAVGIEIPNVEKTSVSMKELMKQIPPQYEDKKLAVALGKDLMGNCVYGELNKMPHLLIAGATGSGKSVCVNTIITSLLMRTKPDEVKLLLVDPKKVEFTPYREIPHLLGPVITDGEEANRALKVIVNMMDNRYELFSMAGVRNIAGYNGYIENHPEEGLKKLPWIVVIIDELADLMLVAAKEVESSIQRITQLARAAGIHLIVATQRPSVDVITGIIKANIPSRIAFAVSSAVDSRTILDQVGAEKLLGLGDMLYIPVGEQVATRVQGAFVSDEEVAAICEFASRQAKPKYDDAFLRLEALDGGIEATSSSAGHDDPLYEEVKEFVISTRKASTSLIQRKFSIGYARAARLIDVLEERGIIGAARGSKPREVYAKSSEDDEADISM